MPKKKKEVLGLDFSADNLALRSKVCTTEERHTRKRPDGLTSICAYSQIERATKERGPYGQKRGFLNSKVEGYDHGRLFYAEFYYPGGTFPIWNSINKGPETLKMIQTDTLTKCLSMLGFNADVFMGEFVNTKTVVKNEDDVLEGFGK